MSLTAYINNLAVDQIENDAEFIETEYITVQDYCQKHNFCLSDNDINEIRNRGLEESLYNWKWY